MKVRSAIPHTSLLTSYLHLHGIVVLLGFTAILGALISLSAGPLVWYRMLFATLGLGAYLRFHSVSFRVSLSRLTLLLGIGLVVALHWITFFHAIKVSNVSVTLGVFASTTLFTSLLEPLFQKKRILWLEVLIGLAILLGIYIIFQFEFKYLEGILYALLSALLNAVFAVLNRKISHHHPPAVISFWEMLGGFLFMSLFFLFTGAFAGWPLVPALSDFFWLLVLGILCTSYAFTAIVHIMKRLSAYAVVLAINLEPVYGIILARLFFPESESMSAGFYLGTLIIILSVLSYPWLRRRLTGRGTYED